MERFLGLWTAVRKLVLTFPVAGFGAIFLTGAVFWGGFNWSLELTNTETFCISCHAMKDFVYEEYKTTIHYNNRTGVRAICPDCHVPRKWIYKVARKVRATNELVHWVLGSIDTRGRFEAKRFALAREVWSSMESTDSRECRNCHGINFMTRDAQSGSARLMHARAQDWGKTCIDCHKGIAHSLPKRFDRNANMDELHEIMRVEEMECRQCHKDMAGPPRGQNW